MVDDDLVAAKRAQGGLNGSGDSLAGFDVTDNGSIFGVVAALAGWSVVLRLCGTDKEVWDGSDGSRTCFLTSGTRA